jgi:hypothetical protein
MIIGQTGKLPGKHLFVKAFLLILLVLALSNPALLASQKINPKNVLVLASYKSTGPVGYLWERGIRSVFEAETSPRIETHVEYLDLNGFVFDPCGNVPDQGDFLSAMWKNVENLKPAFR